jgi:hypothetical protein
MRIPTPQWQKFLRDSATFTLGFAAGIHQLFISGDPNPYALTLIAALLGLPAVLQRVEKPPQ